jgi:type II secretory pathway pseudopilin PulG
MRTFGDPKCLSRSGFTILELLVSAALVSLVMLALLAITSSTVSLTQGTQRSIGGKSVLRSALDRLSADVESGVFRPDLPAVFSKQAGNDAFTFYISSPGYTGDRPLAKVSYRIDGRGLVRTISGSGWEQDPPQFGVPTTPSTGSEDLLGPHIFRMETGFFGADGIYSNNPPENFADAQAVVIALAAMEEKANSGDAVSLLPLAAKFPDSDGSRTALELWSELIQSSEFPQNDLEFSFATMSGIHVAGRVIPLRHKR